MSILSEVWDNMWLSKFLNIHFFQNFKTVSKIIGKNFILTKNELIEGCTVFIGRAVEAKKVITLLNEKDIKYRVLPDFPY